MNDNNNDKGPSPAEYMKLIGKIPAFAGSRDVTKAEAWMTVVKTYKTYFAVASNDSLFIKAIVTSFTDRAEAWWNNTSNTITTWTQFETKFHAKFLKGNSDEAWTKLRTIKQKPDQEIQQFTNELNTLFNSASITDDTMKILIFISAVNPNIGFELEKKRESYTSYLDVTEKAASLASILMKYNTNHNLGESILFDLNENGGSTNNNVISIEVVDEMVDIILVSTDTSDGIKVKKFRFDNRDVEYYAISYRWNYIEPWYLKHEYYETKIKSFYEDDFIRLCENYKQEVAWVWIDTISINQGDGEEVKAERNKTIYRMAEIYKKAVKVLAVPDLGYCQYYQEEWINVEKARYEDIGHSMKVSIIQNWIERAWVISERIIGYRNKKLEVYFLTTKEVIDIEEIIHWEDNFVDKSEVDNPVKLLECLIESKCEKFVDRAIAILPLSKYQFAKGGFIENSEIKSMDELKMRILDILEPIDKVLFVLREVKSGACERIKPTFITKYEKGEMNPDVYSNGGDWCGLSFDYNQQKLTIQGKYIKIDVNKVFILMCSEYVNFDVYEIHCLECLYIKEGECVTKLRVLIKKYNKKNKR